MVLSKARFTFCELGFIRTCPEFVPKCNGGYGLILTLNPNHSHECLFTRVRRQGACLGLVYL
jgi:hypothetical protein